MIIKCDKRFFIERCEQRGYDVKNVMDCVVSKNGDEWEIDIDHPKYPKKNHLDIRPGTELKKLLSNIGIKSNDGPNGCGCSDRAKHIDYMEQVDPGWTERNIEQVIDWMQEEAKKRKLPFIRVAAKVLVKLAIRRAKK